MSLIKIKDIKVGDVIVAKWGAADRSPADCCYVLQVGSIGEDAIYNKNGGMFPSELCTYYKLCEDYITIVMDVDDINSELVIS